jgi:hypothetical protein
MCNKHNFEATVLRHPADIIYKFVILLQFWTPTTTKVQERESLSQMAGKLKLLLHVELSANEAYIVYLWF